MRVHLLCGTIGSGYWRDVVFFAQQVDLAQGQLGGHRPSVFPAIHGRKADAQRLSHRLLSEVELLPKFFDTCPEVFFCVRHKTAVRKRIDC
jgi:hypothetical protein